MARKKLKSATDQRKFTIVYNDFLESNLLNYYEKMVFIAIKKFANNETMSAFPSVNTIKKLTGISVSQIKRSLDNMEELGIIKIEHSRGKHSNIYTLYDFAELWNAGSSEEVAAVKEEYEDKKLISILEAKGYKVVKEKEPDISEPTKVTDTSSTKLKSYSANNVTPESEVSQEQYTIEQIKKLFNYDIMIADEPLNQSNIDAVIDILHTVLNSTKKTTRIAGENKPTAVVQSKLMKLNKESILYAIERYNQQTERITNPTAYMLTLLYNAKEQMSLDYTNQVQHDMSDWKNN